MTVGDLASYINGYGFPSSEWGTSGRPIIRIQNLTGSSAVFNYFDGDVGDRYLVRPGEILVSWSASLGVFLWDGPEAWLNQHIFRVTDVADDVDPGFLYYVLLGFIDEVRDQTHGSTMKHVTRRDFLATQVPLPPLPEQQAIAHILRTVQQAREQTEQVIAAARELKRSLVQHLFTFGPSLPAESGSLETKPSVFGAVPSGWEVRPLGDLGTLVDGDWILKKYYSDGGVRLLQVGDVGLGSFIGKSNRWITAESAKELRCTFVREGQVLISRMPDPIGRACQGPVLPYPAITAVDVTMMTPNPLIVDRDYLVEVLNAEGSLAQSRRLAGGATRQRVSRRNLEQVRVPVPPLRVQRQIAEVLGRVGDKIAAEEQRRDALAALFDSLLHDLMSARLRVGALDLEVV